MRIDGRSGLRTITPGVNFITSAMGPFFALGWRGAELQLLRSKAAAGAVVEPNPGENE
jgi:hypothetical protein